MASSDLQVLLCLPCAHVFENHVRHSHRDTAEVGHEMGALLVSCKRTLGTLSAVLLAKRQHVTTVATPVGTNVRELLETMRNAMVDLLLLWVGLSVRFTDTLRDYTGITLSMTGVLAVLTLHSGRVLEEVAAKSTSHDVVELLRYKLVAVHLVNKLLALTNSSLTVEAEVEWTTILDLLNEA